MVGGSARVTISGAGVFVVRDGEAQFEHPDDHRADVEAVVDPGVVSTLKFDVEVIQHTEHAFGVSAGSRLESVFDVDPF
jgi:hypothetical protein